MKKIFLILTACFCGTFVFAQTEGEVQPSENEIELPDVTTVISGGALTAGKDSVPDYKKILPDKNTGSLELPEMESVQKKEQVSQQYVQNSSDEKNVYAQGSIGGGFPFSFAGDFDIYRMSGNSPFKVSFFHKNAEDFADKKAADGYFFRKTGIEAEKKFLNEKSEFVFSGWYKNQNEGLQSKSPVFTDYLWNDIGGKMSAKWSLKNGWYIQLGGNGSYFNRYGTKSASDSVFESEWEKSSKYFSFVPQFSAGWKNLMFDVNFLAKYETQLNVKETDSLEKAPEASSAEAVHKGEFRLNFDWTDENVKVYASAGVIAGNSLGKQNVLFPFLLGGKAEIPYGLSFRPLCLKIEGGLDSVLESAGNLEQKYLFAALYCLSSEQSDWYGQISASVPVQDFLSVNLSGEFRKTAFDNGVWTPDYKTSPSSAGFYVIKQENRTELKSVAELSADFEKLKFSGSWKSYWLDVPSYEDEQSLTASVIFEPDNLWNLKASITQNLGDDAEKVPVLDFFGSVRASNSIRLALEATDIIKLVTVKTRAFAHSQYKQNCGHITALVKFQF